MGGWWWVGLGWGWGGGNFSLRQWGLIRASGSSADSCQSHQLATAAPPYDEGALQPGASSRSFPHSSADAAGPPGWTCGWMLPGSGWPGLHVRCVFWLRLSVWRLLVDRWGVPEAGHGNHGGVGLVLGPAGDHPDLPLRQRYGLHQGRRRCNFVLLFIFTPIWPPFGPNSKYPPIFRLLSGQTCGGETQCSDGMCRVRCTISLAALMWIIHLLRHRLCVLCTKFQFQTCRWSDNSTWVCVFGNECCLLCASNAR